MALHNLSTTELAPQAACGPRPTSEQCTTTRNWTRVGVRSDGERDSCGLRHGPGNPGTGYGGIFQFIFSSVPPFSQEFTVRFTSVCPLHPNQTRTREKPIQVACKRHYPRTISLDPPHSLWFARLMPLAATLKLAWWLAVARPHTRGTRVREVTVDDPDGSPSSIAKTAPST